MKTYIIQYYEEGLFSKVQEVEVVSKTKADAYFDFINLNNVYGAWVYGCKQKDGSTHLFNTCCGNPY